MSRYELTRVGLTAPLYARSVYSLTQRNGKMTAAEKRINMRISQDNLDLIREAAQSNGQDMTAFILGAALSQARSVVLESRVTRLTASEATKLEEFLDAEPEPVPALVELLRRTANQEFGTSKDARV